MRESEIQSHIIKKLEAAGWYLIKIIQCNKNGFPDLIALRQGSTIFIEVKAKGKKARPLQEYRHQQLKKQGFKTLVIDDHNDPQLEALCQ